MLSRGRSRLSDQQPPSGTPEYLEYGGGSPLPPDTAPPAEPSGGRSRRAWWIGGGVVVLLGAGAGAWAALGFFQQGAQPAEALPSSTIAYVSIDLDPAGGQKLDAFRTLNKFPAFKDEVGIDSVDELRHRLGDELVSRSGCEHLDYDRDIDPWLGDRAALAAVHLPGSDVDSVVVVQVTDETKAREGIASLNDCATSRSDSGTGVVVHDGWAVLARDQELAQKVVDAAQDSALADDASYRRWTGEVGEAGVLNAYASPDAGRYLGQALDGVTRMFRPEQLGEGFSGDLSMERSATPSITGSAFHGVTSDDEQPFADALADFHGGAATLRFTGDGLELAMAGEGGSSQLSEPTGTDAGQLVQRLPEDTAAVAAVSFRPGWLDRQLDSLATLSGGLIDRDEAARQFSQETGLDLPGDVDTLLGSGVALGISDDFDFEAAENSDDGSGLPIGAVVKGDATAITSVLDKIRAKVGDQAFLGSDTSDGLVAIGPSASYRKDLLAGGHLGDDDTFTSVIPDAGRASGVLYVDIDALEPSIAKASAGDQESLDNLRPLRAIGVSTWTDGGTSRFSLKVSTN